MRMFSFGSRFRPKTCLSGCYTPPDFKRQSIFGTSTVRPRLLDSPRISSGNLPLVICAGFPEEMNDAQKKIEYIPGARNRLGTETSIACSGLAVAFERPFIVHRSWNIR